MKRAKSHARAGDQTSMTVSLPKQLKGEICELAKLDGRSRSNWLVRQLGKIVDRKLREKKISVLPLAAEQPGEYRARKKTK